MYLVARVLISVLGIAIVTTKMETREIPKARDSFRATLKPASGPPLLWEDGSCLDAETAWIGLTKTVDGGKTWRRVELSPVALTKLGLEASRWSDPDYRDLIYNEILRHTRFVTANHGWLSLVYGKSGGQTWETKDGGATWVRAKRSHGDFQELLISNLFFYDNSVGWAVRESTTGGLFTLCMTRDGGKSWTPCGTPVRASLYRIEAPFFLSQHQGWAISVKTDGTETSLGVVTTLDGGCHWDSIGRPPLSKVNFGAGGELFYLNESQGWMVGGPGENGLYSTNDGGHSWVAVATPGKDANFTSVYFENPRNGWLIWANGDLLSTIDGGVTWEVQARAKTSGLLGEATRDGKWKRGTLLLMWMRGTQGEEARD